MIKNKKTVFLKNQFLYVRKKKKIISVKFYN
jgi:hypothetical protein